MMAATAARMTESQGITAHRIAHNTVAKCGAWLVRWGFSIPLEIEGYAPCTKFDGSMYQRHSRHVLRKLTPGDHTDVGASTNYNC